MVNMALTFGLTGGVPQPARFAEIGMMAMPRPIALRAARR